MGYEWFYVNFIIAILDKRFMLSESRMATGVQSLLGMPSSVQNHGCQVKKMERAKSSQNLAKRGQI